MFKTKNKPILQEPPMSILDKKSMKLQQYTQSSKGLAILTCALKELHIHVNDKGILFVDASKLASNKALPQYMNVTQEKSFFSAFMAPVHNTTTNENVDSKTDKDTIKALSKSLKSHSESVEGLDSLAKHLVAFGVNLNQQGQLKTWLSLSSVSLFRPEE